MVNFLFYLKKKIFLEMKNQYIKLNSNRHVTNEAANKNQLTSRLKVIEFLKDQLYPTGKFIFYFYFKIKIFIKFRFINIIISNIK